MADVTKEQVRGALQAVLAVSEAIRELGEVPSGHLYAQLSGHLDLPSYTKIIDLLKRSGVVEEKGHLLRWTGPAKSEVAAPAP